MKPHEEIIEELVGSIKSDLLSTGTLLHPIVVELSHGLILDGSHRFEALRRLCARKVLAYTVDYFSEEVELKTWYRVVSEHHDIGELLKVLSGSLCAVFERVGVDAGLEALKKRKGAVLLMSHGSDVAYLMLSEGPFPFREVARVDEALRRFGIRYDTETNVISGLSSGDVKLGYAVPALSKEEVVEWVSRGETFPPKSTRHVVQDRILYTLTPLEVMTTDDESVRERVLRGLASAETVSLGPGQFIDRPYEERVRVVVHRGLRNVPYPPEISRLVGLTARR